MVRPGGAGDDPSSATGQPGLDARAARPAASPASGNRRTGAPRRRRRPPMLFRAYWLAVVAGGGALIAGHARHLSGARLVGPHPLAFGLFSAALLVAELKPLPLLRRDGGGEATVSWAFSFALLFVAGPVSAALVAAAATAAADLLRRKSLERVSFNAAQIALCLFAAGAIFTAADGGGPTMPAAGPSVRWLATAAVAAIVVFLLNGLITTVVIALAEGDPVVMTVRAGILVNLSTDGTLLGMAPVLAVIAIHSPLLTPLLLATAWVVYRSTYLALQRKYEAEHDALTGLGNRRAFDMAAARAFEAARRGDRRFAFLLLDLDGFKAINDRLGHHVGDLVLRQLGARLDGAKRPGDVVARLGGDEFALITRVADEAEAASFAGELLAALRQPCVVDGFPLAVRGSFGVAVFPDHGDTTDTLLHQADVAMYYAKQRRLGVASPGRRSDTGHGRLALLADLSGALERNELVLYYQPQVTLPSLRVCGVEALVRWQHPRFGLLAPGEFIPLAEQTELIQPLTDYVIGEALRQSAEWSRAGLDVPIAVNASARSLRDPRFAEAIARLLAEHGVDPGLLELEITENTLMAEPTQEPVTLGILRDLGVRLSIDDFGTGYSSLAALRDLSFDRLKVDGSFVTGMADGGGNAVIVRTIIELARNLGLETMAEGVEDDRTLSALVAAGCSAAQGYLIAKPAPADELTPWLERRLAPAQSGAASIVTLPDNESVTP